MPGAWVSLCDIRRIDAHIETDHQRHGHCLHPLPHPPGLRQEKIGIWEEKAIFSGLVIELPASPALHLVCLEYVAHRQKPVAARNIFTGYGVLYQGGTAMMHNLIMIPGW